MPHSSSVPVRKFSTSTSCSATSRPSSALPSGLRRSSVMPRLLRLVTFHHSGTPSLCGASRRKRIALAGHFHFQNLGAEIGEHGRGKGAGDDGRDVEHAQARKRAGGGARVGSGRSCRDPTPRPPLCDMVISDQIRITRSAYPGNRMDIRQLKTFVEVAANGSYARTAAIVGVAQSALSRQLSALERGIGRQAVSPHRARRGSDRARRAHAAARPRAGRRTPAPGQEAASGESARSRTAKSRSGWYRWPRAG